MNPKSGDLLTCGNTLVGVFGDNQEQCLCGGNSFHVSLTAKYGAKEIYLCANDFRLSDSGWIILEDREEWFMEYANQSRIEMIVRKVLGML